MLRTVTGAQVIGPPQRIQSLWSGYGSILRYPPQGAHSPSVVVKHVSPPSAADHPRGWNTDHSHTRKLKSYQVEPAWCRDWAQRCPQTFRAA